jgi:hypothetical protein
MIFTYEDLYWKQATNPLGMAFAMGFGGGRAIRIDKEARR